MKEFFPLRFKEVFEGVVADEGVKRIRFEGKFGGRGFDEFGLGIEFFGSSNGVRVVVDAGGFKVVSEIAGAAANV